MPKISVKKLIDYHSDKLKQLSSLEQRRINLLSRVDNIDLQIESVQAQINTIKNELNSQFKSMVPDIEVTSFGLDERGRKIWGGIITFPFLDIKFYKILHEFDLFFEDFDTRPVEFNNRIREVILTWLHTDNNLSDYADLTPSQKNIITECIRNIHRENANLSRLSLHLMNE